MGVGVGLRGKAHMKALGYAQNGNQVRAPEGVRIVSRVSLSGGRDAKPENDKRISRLTLPKPTQP